MKKVRYRAHRVRTEEITDSRQDNPFENVSEASLDPDNKVIKGVCIMGRRESLNGYVYQDQAISTLTKLSEGAKWFVNHPSKSEAKDRDGVRDVRDWAGVFRSAYRDGNKVLADLYVRESFWDLARDVAIMQPKGLGNSINSRVKVFKDEKGNESILDIERLKSVDLVASAATTDNLFESLPEASKDDLREEAFHDIQELFEGLLKDRLKEKEFMREINRLQWDAGEVIDDILRQKDINFSEKKTQIGSVLDDLEKEVGKLMTSLKSKGKEDIDDDEPSASPADTKSGTEDAEMDGLKDLTIELLNKERPDLLDEIKSAFEDAERIKGIEKTNEDLTSKVEELQGKVDSLTEENEKLTKDNEEMKTKLDAVDNEKAAAEKDTKVTEMLTEAKLPKEAVTEHFRAQLLKMDEEEIAEAIKDRLSVWQASPKVKNSGGEYSEELDESKKDKDKDGEKKEAAKKDFVKKMK